MSRLFYLAVFHEAEEGGYWVTFPDFPECMTQGDTPSEAYEMAFDALGFVISDMEKEGVKLPPASKPEDIKLSNSESLVIIEFDMLSYLKNTVPRRSRKH